MPPRRLPLYSSIPRAVVEYTTPQKPTPGACTRCALGATVKNVCAKSDGTAFRGPGGVWVLGGAPLASEDFPGAAPMGGAAGKYLRGIVAAAQVENVVWSFAVRCASPHGGSLKDKSTVKAVDACRVFVAEDMRHIRPSRILAVGDVAARALFGEDVPATRSVRFAYGWTGPDAKHVVPVFLLPDPADAIRYRTLRGQYEADLRWALTHNPEPPPWTEHYTEVLDREDSRAAVLKLRESWAAYQADVLAGRREDDPYAGLAWDVEATGQQWASDYRVISVAVAPTWAPGEAFLWNRGMTGREDLQPLLDLLADPTVPKVGQNVKYDANAILSAYGVEVRNLALDTRLVSRLVEPDTDADLDNLGWTVGCGGHKAEAAVLLDKAVKAINKNVRNAEKDAAKAVGYLFADAAPVLPSAGAGAKSIAYGMLPGEVLGRYNVRDTVTTARTAVRLSHKLRTKPHEGQRRVWDEVVGRASEVFSRVESRGFPVDRDGIYAAADVVAEKIRAAREEIRVLAPDLDPNSGDQKAKYLYETLGLKTEHKTESGAPATDRAALTELKGEHPLIAPLIAYSELTHLRGTYLDGDPKPGEKYGTMGMLRHLRPGPGGLYYVHTTYNLDGARTGRLSSSNPNLQNIPRAEDELGKLIKDLFVAPPGWSWLQLDYSQLELRVAAILSQDPVMFEIFNSGIDYHLRTAELIAPVFGHTEAAWKALSKEAKKSLRSYAKCFHPDTEVLCRTRGWVRIVDLKPGDEVAQAHPKDGGHVDLSWVEPTEVFTKHHAMRRLVHLKNEGMDLRVTPDHRMLVYRKNGKPEDVFPAEVPSARGWVNAGHGPGAREVDATLLRLAVATQADGSYTGNAIRWGFTKARKVARLRDLLNTSGLPYTESVNGRGVTDFYLGAEHAPRVRDLLDPDKSFPWWWQELTPELRGVVLDEVPLWDGHGRDNWRMRRYNSTVTKNLDVVQALAATTGRKTRLASSACGAISIRDKATTRGGNLAMTDLPYTDEVACLSVPSTYVLVRDGGIPVVVGQTVNFGLLYGMGVKTLASRMGCDLATAERTMKAVLGKLRRLSSWIDKRKWEADTTGVVWTEWRGLPGRARPIHTMSFKGTVAVNTPVQGTASEFCLASVCEAEEAIANEGLSEHAYLVGTVHDSVLTLVRNEYIPEVSGLVASIMEGWLPNAPIRLQVDGDAGQKWGSLHEITIPR